MSPTKILSLLVLLSINGVAFSYPPPPKSKVKTLAQYTKEDIIERLIGKWEVEKTNNPGLLPGYTFNFEKNGNYHHAAPMGNAAQGTYEIVDGKLKCTLVGGLSDTDTFFKKLTFDEMEVENDQKIMMILKKVK
ncbi:hypothetical protein KIH39_14635 [Telmatocola sphagniphila]|uniref:Lipocalin-like domain-containing protein n=1 Tax=Telmatocola sphagniphila TaxID=1123043 RepID=A0A8E6B4A1_9BACT|nr:hypothetical protein [Telmatocola sphagniphila]QVL30095.1 hypothetical protein KIH39_14635 [Telmatocola sphagniphila]